jgi:hypothetical protein
MHPKVGWRRHSQKNDNRLLHEYCEKICFLSYLGVIINRVFLLSPAELAMQKRESPTGFPAGRIRKVFRLYLL